MIGKRGLNNQIRCVKNMGETWHHTLSQIDRCIEYVKVM